MAAPELLTAKEVAGLLRVSPRHVDNLVKAGAMVAPVRLGRCVRWRRDAVEEWIRNGCPRRPHRKSGVAR